MSNAKPVLNDDIIQSTQSTVWMKRTFAFDPYRWGDEHTMIGSATVNQGGFTPATIQDAQGGIRVYNLLRAVPGTSDFDLMFKHIVNDKNRRDIVECWWNIDNRIMCGNRDDAEKWLEIFRYTFGHSANRQYPAGSSGADEESIITLNWQSAFHYVIQRVAVGYLSGFIGAFTVVAVDISAGTVNSCYGCTIPTYQPSYSVLSSVDTGSTHPYVASTNYGDDLNNWTVVELSDWTTAPDRIKRIGDLVLVVNPNEATEPLMRSKDGGTTFNLVPNALWTASTTPTCIDAISQSAIVMGGLGGNVFFSNENGTRWNQINNGSAATTTSDLVDIKFAPYSPQTIWAGAANGDVIRTTNRSNFAPVTTPYYYVSGVPTNVTEITAVFAVSEYMCCICDGAGRLIQTEDGGLTWEQQEVLPNLPAGALDRAKFEWAGHDCAVLVIYSDASSANTGRVYRSVDMAASGRWEQLEVGMTDGILTVGAASPNHFMVGGNDDNPTPASRVARIGVFN